jgi:hypothetical protein
MQTLIGLLLFWVIGIPVIKGYIETVAKNQHLGHTGCTGFTGCTGPTGISKNYKEEKLT